MLHNWESSRREGAILTPGQGWAAGDPPDKELGPLEVRVGSGNLGPVHSLISYSFSNYLLSTYYVPGCGFSHV